MEVAQVRVRPRVHSLRSAIGGNFKAWDQVGWRRRPRGRCGNQFPRLTPRGQEGWPGCVREEEVEAGRRESFFPPIGGVALGKYRRSYLARAISCPRAAACQKGNSAHDPKAQRPATAQIHAAIPQEEPGSAAELRFCGAAEDARASAFGATPPSASSSLVRLKRRARCAVSLRVLFGGGVGYWPPGTPCLAAAKNPVGAAVC